MQRRHPVKARIWGYLVGGSVTISIVAVYLCGVLDRGVLQFLDFNFRHVNRLVASDRILLIDINDYALERVHRWPWPRRLHAELIAELDRLGARAIVMDIVFAEPMEPRLEHPALAKDYDVDRAEEVHGQVRWEDAIHDDDELVQAIRAASNVYLAMFCRSSLPDRPVRRVRQVADELFGADPLTDPDTFRQALPFDPGDELQTLYHHYSIRRLLTDDFTLGAEELSERLHRPAEVIDAYLAQAKRLAARQVVSAVLTESPEADFREVHRRVLPEADYETLSADRSDLLRAFRNLKAMRPAVYEQPELLESFEGHLQQGWDVTPPLDKLARAARGIGFATYEPDIDGVLRRIPLLIDIEGHLVKHLGFAVACDLLGIDEASIRLQGGLLTMEDVDGGNLRRVPVDSQGRTLLNWHLDRRHRDWQHSFDHLPVSRVMELVLNRRTIAQNQARRAIKVAQAVELAAGHQTAVYARYEADVRRRNAIVRDRRYHGTQDTAEARTLAAELQELDQRIAQDERRALQFLQLMQAQARDLTPESEEEKRLFARVQSLSEQLGEDARAKIEQANTALRARNDELTEQLRQRVADKVCFVGYTASTVADTVPAPVFGTMPGVLAHANVVNSLLQNRFPRVAPGWMNALLILLAGAAVTLVTASRGPWVSLVSVLLLIVLLLAIGFALFAGGTWYVASVVAVLAAFVCWAFVTLYRELTEQRAKRQFSRALAQYTSPAVAARIAEDQAARDLLPRPCEVTLFFSDLQGFTAISERLGAEHTREVLNPYLEAMSRVLVGHRAIINKFMGDGIFAFFNPPILDCPNHARAACEAALDSAAALERLKSDPVHGALGAEMGLLHMRVGINSGAVFVGDYGSASKLDYTCIGDAVNVAARLEPANKVFGTHLLVSEQTRCQTDDTFEYRPLGSVQVAGRQEAVAVYELLGRRGQVNDGQRRYAELWAEAVRCFQGRRWDDALAAVKRCSEIRGDDPAAGLYLELIDQHRWQPPPADWKGSITLASK
ncbi:MAG: CHASE2 domain-containing protein [Planctomycetota bacterium]|jgi:class 3 adenylate cyclase